MVRASRLKAVEGSSQDSSGMAFAMRERSEGRRESAAFRSYGNHSLHARYSEHPDAPRSMLNAPARSLEWHEFAGLVDLWGGQCLTFHARAAHRVACVRGWRFGPRGITITRADEGQVTVRLLAKPCGLTGAVAQVADEDDVTRRKPADETGQQQSGDVRWRLLPRALRTIPLWGRGPGDQDRESPGPSREGQVHEHRDDDPCMPPAIGRIAVRRLHAIAMPSLAKPLGARMLAPRLVAGEEHRPRRDPMV